MNDNNRYKVLYARNSIIGILLAVGVEAMRMLTDLDQETSRWLLKLLCPAVYPIPLNAVEQNLENARNYLDRCSQSVMWSFAGLVAPEIHSLATCWDRLRELRNGGHTITNARKVVESAVFESDYLADYPEIKLDANLKSIYRVFSKNKAYTKDEQGYITVTSSQLDAWDQILRLDLHPQMLSKPRN